MIVIENLSDVDTVEWYSGTTTQCASTNTMFVSWHDHIFSLSCSCFDHSSLLHHSGMTITSKRQRLDFCVTGAAFVPAANT